MAKQKANPGRFLLCAGGVGGIVVLDEEVGEGVDELGGAVFHGGVSAVVEYGGLGVG